MAIQLQALDMFQTATSWTAKGIANLDGKDRIKQNGTYGGALGALGRSKIEIAENNRVRTELLRALGNAFGLAGMTEKDGTVSFSKDFMDKLERLLGPAFKRGDFKIDADGAVTSGRPLTARRISAILAKAETATVQESTGDTAPIAQESKATALTKTGGVRKEETYGAYAKKLAAIKAELPKLLKKGDDEHVFSFFRRVEMTLDFLYNELDVNRSEPGASDPSALRNDEEYELLKEIGDLKEGDKPSFQYYDDKAKKFVPLENTYKYQNEVLWHKIGGGLLHLERAKFRTNESDDIAPLRKYIVDNLRLFVMKSIDTFFEAKKADKLPLFFEHLREPGACIEDQCLHMVEFEATNLVEGEKLSAKEVEELERIANQEQKSSKAPDVNTLIDDLINEIDEPWFLEKEGFDDDIAKFLEGKLLGKTATLTKYNTKTHKFDQPLLENGKAVVRPLTAEDIRTYGELVYKETFAL